MTVIALVNNKGGVGKTTTAVSLSAGLTVEGRRRVLLVDLDAQGSAGLSLGLKRADLSPGTAEVVLDGTPIRTATHGTAAEASTSCRGQWRWRLLTWRCPSSRVGKWS